MAILLSEQAIVVGVYEKLLTHALFDERHVGIHPKESLPNAVGHYYVSINGVGISAGRTHTTSGGVRDLLYSIDMSVYVRSQDIPKDRNWKRYIGSEKTLSYLCAVVDSLIDFDYDVNANANAFLLANETGSQKSQGFVEPLRFQNRTKPQNILWSEVGANVAGSDMAPGEKAIITYTGARRIVSR